MTNTDYIYPEETNVADVKIFPGHEPVIQGGSPSIDYMSLSAKNAQTGTLADRESIMIDDSQMTILNSSCEQRLEGLKLAYTALTPRIFGTKQPVLDDIKELYELAEYNVRFILNEDINLEYMSKDEKLRKVINKHK